MASYRENIMARLAVDLAYITTGHGYATTVKTTERWVQAPPLDALNFDNFPLVMVEEGPEIVEYLPGQMMLCAIAIKVHACIDGGSSEPSPTTLNAFIADIRKCIEADPTLNANAIDATVGNITVEVGQTNPHFARAVLDVQIQYERATTSP